MARLVRVKPEDVVFLASTHSYFLEGNELTSVTAALEAVGITDFSKVPIEHLERAQIVGEYVHKIAHLYADGELEEASIDPNIHGYYEAIKSFFAERVHKVIKVEALIFNQSLGFAGTTDIVYEDMDGRICLDDYKTGERAHPAAKLQTAAYKAAFQRNYGIKIDDRGGVLLRPDGEYHRIPYNDRADYHDFVRVLGVARWKRKNKIV